MNVGFQDGFLRFLISLCSVPQINFPHRNWCDQLFIITLFRFGFVQKIRHVCHREPRGTPSYFPEKQDPSLQGRYFRSFSELSAVFYPDEGRGERPSHQSKASPTQQLHPSASSEKRDLPASLFRELTWFAGKRASCFIRCCLLVYTFSIYFMPTQLKRTIR